jgi:hypothetical protein
LIDFSPSPESNVNLEGDNLSNSEPSSSTVVNSFANNNTNSEASSSTNVNTSVNNNANISNHNGGESKYEIIKTEAQFLNMLKGNKSLKDTVVKANDHYEDLDEKGFKLKRYRVEYANIKQGTPAGIKRVEGLKDKFFTPQNTEHIVSTSKAMDDFMESNTPNRTFKYYVGEGSLREL